MIRKINVILLTLLIFIGVSCSEDYLETAPTDAISASDALSSPENMMLVLNGLHRMMYGHNPLPDNYWHATGQSHYIPTHDAISGNLIHSARGNGWMRRELQWLHHTDANRSYNMRYWYQLYHIINSVNLIINTVEEGDFVMDEDMNNILGQSHAYRSWAYLQLVTTWAKGYIISADPSTEPGVPLRIASGAPYDGGPRESVQAIYDQVIADIDQAITYLAAGSDPGGGAAAKSHINVNAAYGIKARVHLSMGDWANASAAAQSARAGYPIMGEEDWLSGFNTLSLSEVMWGAHVISEETNYYASYFYYICPTFNGSQNRGNPKLFPIDKYDQMGVNDYRRKAVIERCPNTNSSASNGEGGWAADSVANNWNSKKEWTDAIDSIHTLYGMTGGHNLHPYMHVKFLQSNPGTIEPDDVIYMRSSEMYLIEAECEAMLGNIGAAQTALAAVAEERDPDYDVTAYTTTATLLAEIKFQRRVELYGEGFGYHDYIRWDEDKDMTGTGASQVLYQDGWQNARPSINDEWIWKIPQREIDANPYLTDNDQN